MRPRCDSVKPTPPRFAFEIERPLLNPRHTERLATAVLFMLCFGLSSQVAAESKLLLGLPERLEAIAATTFDSRGRAVGRSWFEIESSESGTRHLTIELSVEGGGTNRSEATLAPVAAALVGNRDLTRQFRITEERSQATRADGVSLDLLVIDHIQRRVSCYPSGADRSAGRHIELPANDRVVNVALPYLFRPLATGEIDQLHFQLAVCRDGPMLRNMIAVRGPRVLREGREVIEIRYGPDFGSAIAWLASRLLPRFSFWLDSHDGEYLGHRMPLHREGPEILLVRKGLTPTDLGLAHD
jgi:hypothetical protein